MFNHLHCEDENNSTEFKTELCWEKYIKKLFSKEQFEVQPKTGEAHTKIRIYSYVDCSTRLNSFSELFLIYFQHKS